MKTRKKYHFIHPTEVSTLVSPEFRGLKRLGVKRMENGHFIARYPELK